MAGYINRNDGHLAVTQAVIAANPLEFVHFSSILTRPGAKIMRLEISISLRPASANSPIIRTEHWTVGCSTGGSLIPSRLTVTERSGVVA